MKNKTNSKNAGRRRNSNRNAGYYRLQSRVGTSFGPPVHIGFYLHPMLDGNSGADREKIVERFNAEFYG